jgi:hypothetical protein
VLRGMTGNSARVVMAKRMEAIFRREEIVYAAECKVSTCVDEKGKVHYTQRLKRSLTGTIRCLGRFLQVCHQTGGLSTSLS